MNVTKDMVTCWMVFSAHDYDDTSLLNVLVSWHRADPFALHVSFPQPSGSPIRWVWSRDLLVEGVTRPAGDQRADIYVQPGPDGSRVHIELNGPRGYLALSVDLVTLGEFLKSTYRIVPAGSEYADLDVDQLLVNWLEGAA